MSVGKVDGINSSIINNSYSVATKFTGTKPTLIVFTCWSRGSIADDEHYISHLTLIELKKIYFYFE